MDDPASGALCWNPAVLNPALEYATGFLIDLEETHSLLNLFSFPALVLLNSPCAVSQS